MCWGPLSALLQSRVGLQLLNKPVGKGGFKRLQNSASVEANFNDKATANQLVNWYKPSTSTSRMTTATS